MPAAVLEDWKRAAEGYKVAKAIAEELQKSLKPAGHYAIPELLDKRRLEYGIPNGAFEVFPAFDKVYVYQIPLPGRGGETYEGTSIVKPESRQSWERNSSPRGILVSAGLQAMDCLYSTGIEIGHIVRFKKLSPFILPVAEFNGHEVSVYVLRDGDIDGSEDLALALNERRCQLENTSKEGYDFRVRGAVGNISGQKKSAYFDPSI